MELFKTTLPFSLIMATVSAILGDKIGFGSNGLKILIQIYL